MSIHTYHSNNHHELVCTPGYSFGWIVYFYWWSNSECLSTWYWYVLYYMYLYIYMYMLKTDGSYIFMHQYSDKNYPPPPTQIRLQQYWYQSKKARVQKYLLTLIFSPFQSRIKRLCISSEGYPKIEYAYMYVQSEMGRWAVIYRNLNTLEQGSKNRMILNRKPASSFVIFINILGWTLKFYTFHLINKTQNILEGLYIVNVSL